MKKSRFTDSQILAILKQAEAGVAAPELCREHGISTATFYKWRSKFGGSDCPVVRLCNAGGAWAGGGGGHWPVHVSVPEQNFKEISRRSSGGTTSVQAEPFQ